MRDYLDQITGSGGRLSGRTERPQRPLPSAGEPRGEILLFTGVR